MDNDRATACIRLPHDANYFVVIRGDVLSQLCDTPHLKTLPL
jgi:hypothetical protein